MSEAVTFARASFERVPKGDRIFVHFNPVSLQYSVANTLENTGEGNDKKQYVAQSTAKLAMDLLFDTTDSGQDVRAVTSKLEAFMEPQNPLSAEAKQRVPSIVRFDWGNFAFQGMVESYKETLDFFSAEGVPLRAAVNLSLSRQDQVFNSGAGSDPAGAGGPGSGVNVSADGDRGATGVATQVGDPDAGRDIAAAAGEENLRFLSDDWLTVLERRGLGPAEAFADGRTGAGPGGAFAGLRHRSRRRRLARIDLEHLHDRPQAGLTTGAGAGFDLGGRATLEAGGSQRANVGGSADLRFEEEG